MRGLAFFILFLVAAAVLIFVGLSRAPDMLANNLSKKLSVPVSIDAMHFALFEIEVKNLEIGNAQGYTLPKAFSAEEIQVETPIQNYFNRDTIQIDEVEVKNIYLGLEFDSPSGTDGNWSKILTHYQTSANLAKKKGKKVHIKKLTLINIQPQLLFRSKGEIQKLPVIDRIQLTDISTEGGFPTDQLMASILGQLLKEVFKQEHINNFLKGLILDSPGKAFDAFIKPFKGLFNALPKEQVEHKYSV